MITCRVTKKQQKKKKADLIKDEGEGDWGTGDAVMDDQPVQGGIARQLPTDWPKDFYPWESCIRPGGSDQDEITLPKSARDETILPGSAGDQPRPGPSTRPTSVRDLPNSTHQRQGKPLLTRGGGDKPVHRRQSTPLLAEGERDRLTPLNSTNIQKHPTPTHTRGYKTKGKEQQKSVSSQEPEGQHSRQDKTSDPEPVRERAIGSGGHSYRPLQRLQDRHRQGLHLCPREQESERDKPPSKVLKSVRWMKSLLGRRHGAEKERKDKEEDGENEDRAPAMETEVEPDPNVVPDLDPNPEQGLTPENRSPTPMEEQ